MAALNACCPQPPLDDLVTIEAAFYFNQHLRNQEELISVGKRLLIVCDNTWLESQSAFWVCGDRLVF